MNYEIIYRNIVKKRKQTPAKGYIENHHIIPRSLGGSNEDENLVALTAREHFICHYLLAKMYKRESNEWYKMQFAFNMMKIASINHDRYFNSRLYEALRKDYILAMSRFASINWCGEGNSQHGTMWICNVELKENKKIKKDEEIPEGWIKGRNKWKHKLKKKIIKKEVLYNSHVIHYLKDIKIKQKNQEKKDKVFSYWNDFKCGNYNSISDFCRKNNLCKMNISNYFREYIKEYSEKSKRSKKFKIN